jgi:hypothetical protein
MTSARVELVATDPDDADLDPEVAHPTADVTERDDGAGGYEALDPVDAGQVRDVPDARPPAFDPEILAKLPEYGLEDRRTRGILAMPDGTQRPLQSGYEGPSAELPRPRTGTGMNHHNVSHVEAHAAATMRLEGLEKATLYLNRAPCPGKVGCDVNLHRMLPPGGKLTIYGPDGFAKVYRGLPTEER